jgi:hypothetical protein
MVLQVSKIIDNLVVILLNYFCKIWSLYMSVHILVKKGKLDYKLVNFNLIENINTLSHDSN